MVLRHIIAEREARAVLASVPCVGPVTTDVAPEALPSFVRTITPIDKYMQGRDKVKIKVRPVVR